MHPTDKLIQASNQIKGLNDTKVSSIDIHFFTTALY